MTTTNTERKQPYWLIWSIEHRAWWKPNACGYTKRIAKAGRYTALEAMNIVASANVGIGTSSNVPRETMLPDINLFDWAE